MPLRSRDVCGKSVDDILVAGGDDVAAEGSFEAIDTDGEGHLEWMINACGRRGERMRCFLNDWRFPCLQDVVSMN